MNLHSQITNFALQVMAYMAENGSSGMDVCEDDSLQQAVAIDTDLQEIYNAVMSNLGRGIAVVCENLRSEEVRELVSETTPPTREEVALYEQNLRSLVQRHGSVRQLSECIEDINSGEYLKLRGAMQVLGEVQHRLTAVNLNFNDTIVLSSSSSGPEDIEQCLTTTKRLEYPATGTVFDEWMRLGPGELGVILAPPGVGKTTALVNIGGGFLEQDGGVLLHFSEELSKAAVTKKYLRRLGINYETCAEHSVYDLVTSKMAELKGTIIVESHPSGTSTVPYISRRVEALLRENSIMEQPRAIIVDYAALMRDKIDGSRYDMLSSIIVKLRQMAGEFGCPVWTATQPQRSPARDSRSAISVNDVRVLPVLGMADVAECWAIPQVTDYLISLNQTDAEREADPSIVRVYPAKIREPNDETCKPRVAKYAIRYSTCQIM